TLVGNPVFIAHAEREGRVVVEEERGGVVVEAEEQHVGLLLGQPLRHRLVALEQRLPVRVLLLALVERHGDGGYVGRADSTDDLSHARGTQLPLSRVRGSKRLVYPPAGSDSRPAACR